MSLPNANFITNKLAIKERWIKLYRNIHNMFLADEFVHVDDFKTMLEQINTRITTVETNMVAGDAAVMGAVTSLGTGLSAHIHPHPLGPVGPPTPPPLPAPPAPAPPASPLVPYIDAIMKAYDASLKAMGPAIAPMGDGLSPEAQTATLTSKSDVGF